MTLTTDRLVLRPWRETDAEALYEYAKNPRVGPSAGWAAHSSVEESRQIIRDILSGHETYAVTLKGGDEAIGSVGLMLGDKSRSLNLSDREGEIGYWIGEPYWGRGLIPEAVRALMAHAFEDLGLETLWCGYYDGNEKSRRAQEKCGFRYHHSKEGDDAEGKTTHFTRMTKARWLAPDA